MFWIGNGWQIEGRRGTGLSDFSIELLTRMREARINLWGSSEWPLYDTSGNAMPVNYHVDKEYLKDRRAILPTSNISRCQSSPHAAEAECWIHPAISPR